MIKTIIIGDIIKDDFIYVLINYNYKLCKVINPDYKIIQSPDKKIWGIMNEYLVFIG